MKPYFKRALWSVFWILGGAAAIYAESTEQPEPGVVFAIGMACIVLGLLLMVSPSMDLLGDKDDDYDRSGS